MGASRLLFLPKFSVEMMDVIAKINETIAPSLQAMGYQLVQLKLADGARRKTLSLMAERSDGVIMSFDDCAEISRTVSALLDVEDPITGAYNLEVCSPGIDRPLVTLADFERFNGYEIKLETLIPIEGRKRFRGNVIGVKASQVLLHCEDAQYEIPHSNIRTAKLVMTDELVDSFMKQAKKQKG